jgi:prefoldin subunit 5
VNPANFPRRKRQKQDEAMERMTLNIQELDKVIATKPENIDELKDRRAHLAEAIENTKKNLR